MKRIFKSYHEALNTFALKGLCFILKKLDVFQFLEEGIHFEILIEKICLTDKYHKLFKAQLGMLLRAGYILWEKDKIILDQPPEFVKNFEQLQQEKQKILNEYPQAEGHLELLIACFKHYPEILRGKKNYMEVMFPKGSLSLVEKIYNGEEAQKTNLRLAEMIRTFIEATKTKSPEKKIKILELGAGVGGTSAFVFDALRPFGNEIQYLYTDISKAFLTKAQDKFKEIPIAIEYLLFDIENEVPKQLFEKYTAHIVFATNVLHATRRIDRSLKNIKSILQENGLLLLNELTERHDYITLSFGLTDGWWLFEDEDKRIEDSPLLKVTSWQAMLEETGFQHVRATSITSSQTLLMGVRGQTSSNLTELGIKSQQPLEKMTKDYLKEIFSRVLRIDKGQFVDHVTFDQYGVDSLVVLEFNKVFGEIFGELPATLLFEYMTIDKLCQYFLISHKELLHKKFYNAAEENKTKKEEDPINAEIIISRKQLFTKQLDTSLEIIRREQPIHSFQKEIPQKIAIIGLSGRYPNAETMESFWELLKTGKDSIQEIPESRWQWQNFYSSEPVPEKSYTKWAGLLDDVDKFDPLFFHISPKEAEMMDPQERLFLETVWKTLEDAGYPKESLENKKIGVFVGVMNSDYSLWSNKGLTGRTAYWSLANRVSYYFDWKGPSLAIDTACSSSLAALHYACEAISNCQCESAIAGGVNLILHPTHMTSLCHLKMLSKGAQCRAFGIGTDGFVVGEGVGAVLLKPLEQALLDKDRIYGVIIGSAMNSGGKTSGYTVPNPIAQAELVETALNRAQVNPESISYIEAHGTGTSLGDPIEISGLSRVFGEKISLQSCPIGSVKSNIGHLESAAGIASLTKVLLQFKHCKLVPSLHCETLNPNITFEKTPFYVQRELTDWKTKNRYPRRAGISSFGAGGANVHIVLEEMLVQPILQEDAKPYYLLTLSAKHPLSLQQRINDLSAYIKTESNLTLESIAYTLNTGRSHFDYRCTIVTASLQELTILLEELQQERIPVGCLKGQVEKDLKDKQLYQQILETTNAKLQDFPLITSASQYREILEVMSNLYLKGFNLAWDLLHQNENHKKIFLPSYPFLRERYWLPEQNFVELVKLAETVVSLHPLIGKNISTLEKQCYETLLKSDAFYLQDHLLTGKRILPGVCYLEMARSAGTFAYSSQEVCGLKNIFWFRPMEVNNTKLISLHLFPKGKRIQFEIQSREGQENTLYGQGEVVYGPIDFRASKLDLDRLQHSLKRKISHLDLYAKFQKSGLCYGPSFRSLQWVKYNEKQAFGYIKLTRKILESPDFSSYFLHPNFLDAALQTVVGLHFKEQKNYLPFSIEAIEWFASSLPDEGYVLAELDSQATQEMPLYNLQITDNQGQVVLQIKGFCLRVLEEIEEKVRQEASSDDHLVLYEPKYEELPIDILNPINIQVTGVIAINVSDQGCRQLKGTLNCEVICFSEEDLTESRTLEMKIASLPANISHLVYLAKPIKDTKGSLPVENLFVLSRAIIKSKRFSSLVGYYLAHSLSSEEIPFVEMIIGFIKSMNQEQLRYRYHLLSYDVQLTEIQALDFWLKEMYYSVTAGIVIRHEENKRYQDCYQPISLTRDRDINANAPLPLKKNGVYLITGGLGGLGFHFACYLAKGYQAKLILIGRSQLDNGKREQIKELEMLGSEVLYISADISQKQDVQRLLEEGRKRFNILQGIIHAAGVIKDSLLTEKTLEDFKAVIAPKVWGLIHLDALTTHDILDFFISFSSLSSVFGNIGQTDYASANSFLDHFSKWRQTLVKENKRQGKTLSINWPLWAEGGMQLDSIQQNYLKNNWGIKPLPTEEGLFAFEQLLRLPLSQCIVLFGNPRRLICLDKPLPLKDVNNSPLLTAEFSIPNEKISAWITDDLLQQVSHVLKIPKENLSIDEDLSHYGFDSISFTQLTNLCNQFFEIQLTPAHFFEFSTLEQCTHYLMQQETEAMRKHYQPHLNVENISKEQTECITPLQITSELQPRLFLKTKEETTKTFVNRPKCQEIAIIGMQAMLPGSKNLEEFWQLLLAGKDAIQEIPTERWDWQLYEGVPKWGGFIDDIDKFDSSFFAISPREAEYMDPQQRLFLQVVWQTIEDAGYTQEFLSSKKTGLFVGVASQDYTELLQRQGMHEAHTPTGVAHSILANRVSYLLNLTGPSEAIDTACSSSLVALHHAVRAIQSNDCELALVGGVNVLLSPSLYISFSKAGMLSPVGRCLTFDKRADGYVRGEGVGAILLKSLTKAQEDNDHIYGVIKGSYVNHGGHVNTLTTPNPHAQAQLIEDLYQREGILPESISYIEAHGTGTSLGDPIEVNGLKKAFQTLDDQNISFKNPYCALGSVKANIGHLEAAAGIAGVIKVLCMLKHKIIPPQANFEGLNPYIELDNSPFYITKTPKPWEVKNHFSRRAGVSSFGFGGCNAHVVLEEYSSEISEERM